MMLHRYVVSRVIWTYMASIAVTYFITLCLFPGLESEIRNCTLGEWLPILIMAVFNLSDFVGKVKPLGQDPAQWPEDLAPLCRRGTPNSAGNHGATGAIHPLELGTAKI